MKAIPTMYNGRQYRSRLEARWAAYFDLKEWEYEYEPFDLPGWIPDFVIKRNPFSRNGKTYKPKFLLVEVKPYLYGEWKSDDKRKIEKALVKANLTDIYDLFLLGSTIEEMAENSYWNIGHTSHMFEVEEDDLKWFDTKEKREGIYRIDNKMWYFGYFEHTIYDHAASCWNKAANEVQWRKP